MPWYVRYLGLSCLFWYLSKHADIAAAAAERRRKRKQQVKLRASNMMNEGGTGAGVGGVGGGGVAEPSEGELSGNNSSYNNARGASAAEAVSYTHLTLPTNREV